MYTSVKKDAAHLIGKTDETLDQARLLQNGIF